ncbi:uncharacterized protein MEPE_06484 [Melanopsichium pennsylvanicum]|uniref:Transmembrane protein n=2 Tax=Melanopsichium pennsylvanicum TaxID=63383 RepID=A0AAJ4XUC1_9BASI|nr:putative protein [Melanopsichium pennsylvanicum 4]SNX87773.1 uncharacterized protein MEPE_06484 [Melanopsichium pennsylvanicum]
MNATWRNTATWSSSTTAVTPATTSYPVDTTTHQSSFSSNRTAALRNTDTNTTATATQAVVMASSTTTVTPDVVANPWNTSLLWSSGIIDNRDPRSNFWPSENWSNTTVPANVNTSPIDYYYSSTQAGDSVNFYFTGHGLSVLDFRGPLRGKYNVTIDDQVSVIIDAYSQTDDLANASGNTLPSVIWTSDTLEEATHSVVMSNLNNISDMHFWGVVINPNNYKAGSSFMPSKSSNTKLIIIASTVTAVVMVGMFILVGSIVYYCKLVRPRRRMQANIDSERKQPLLSSSSATTNTSSRTPRNSSSALRLNMNFLSSHGDLGRVPSRVTATTNESQYWLRPETEMAQVTNTSQSTRTPALFQEVRLGSPTHSVLSSPIDSTPVSEMDPTSTACSIVEPLSPQSPTSHGYATAHMPTDHFGVSEGRPAPAPCDNTRSRSLLSHQHSHSLQLDTAVNSPSTIAGSSSQLHHSRVASTPDADPFQDPVYPFMSTTTSLARNGSRRPLPTPPAPTTPVSPLATLSPSSTANDSSTQTGSNRSGSTNGTSINTNRQYRVEQDACSLHLSEDGLFDDHTGETLLPPPYSPRDAGRHF